jgi:aminoglycoside phosphotransferase (APT) family kinase protein
MFQAPPSPAALASAAEIAGPRATIAEVRVLRGGSHARTHLIRTRDPATEMVLREFPPDDPAARQEASVLTALDSLGGLAPRLLRADLEPRWSDRPSVLISKLAGMADICPEDPCLWAAQLGIALACVHASPVDKSQLTPLTERSGGALSRLSGPAAPAVKAGWNRIWSEPDVLTHSDFWSGNVVWEHGVVTGVVDWSGAAVGPRGYDLGWCRLDLVVLYDDGVADAFLASYQAASGTDIDDWRLWDLWSVARSHDDVETWDTNYVALGRADLTSSTLRQRHAEWTHRLLSGARSPS